MAEALKGLRKGVPLADWTDPSGAVWRTARASEGWISYKPAEPFGHETSRAGAAREMVMAAVGFVSRNGSEGLVDRL